MGKILGMHRRQVVPGKALAPLVACLLCACNADEAPEGTPGDMSDTRPYGGIAEHETLHFTGTEPFWSGDVAGGVLAYASPENPGGESIHVTRFAGRNGVSFSGTMNGDRFILAATPGACSDGMSDRTYPFAVTIMLGNETRNGCGWTGARDVVEPESKGA